MGLSFVILLLVTGIGLILMRLTEPGLLLIVLAVTLLSAGLCSLWRDLRQLQHWAERMASDAAPRQDGVTPLLPGVLQPLAQPLASAMREMQRRQQEALDRVAEISYSTQELSRAASQLADNTQRQSQATSSSAAAVTQISHSIDDINQRISHTRDASEASRSLTAAGMNALGASRQAVEQVATLARQAAGEVGSLEQQTATVAELSAAIRDIAAQTNLLALNAAIEAARAGEMGRGFAVVADEVRHLAQRSHECANHITSSIDQVQTQMLRVREQMQQVLASGDSCVLSATEAESALLRIREQSDSIADQIHTVVVAFEQQSAATRDISRHIEEVASVSTANSDMAEQTSRITHHIYQLTGANGRQPLSQQ
ncbi:hypothetical protein WH50_14360 [Pokkaliibacter plantistimulans]|uniref:Methyl-accepting transducer domain-containing protein n=1 Tax=Pokkaliibacter plantistimulans TaxID=1635171 RepID=A0ABX5LWA5_9GAMM|nr:methyl-accepting chemotaxis protein [Pokkaliibacter plantistimulans]PXF30616.1 hypothetical protein WH50_14360 [Pokkaliibacter plantistimulans]